MARQAPTKAERVRVTGMVALAKQEVESLERQAEEERAKAQAAEEAAELERVRGIQRKIDAGARGAGWAGRRIGEAAQTFNQKQQARKKQSDAEAAVDAVIADYPEAGPKRDSLLADVLNGHRTIANIRSQYGRGGGDESTPGQTAASAIVKAMHGKDDYDLSTFTNAQLEAALGEDLSPFVRQNVEGELADRKAMLERAGPGEKKDEPADDFEARVAALEERLGRKLTAEEREDFRKRGA